MDTCTLCKKTVSIKDLCKDKSKTRGYNRRCHACEREKRKAAGNRSGANVTNDRKRAVILAAKSVPCTDCKNIFPFYVMDLDHLPQFKKKFSLGRYMYHTLADVEEEVRKCEAVCANCHRGRTHNRGYTGGRPKKS